MRTDKELTQALAEDLNRLKSLELSVEVTATTALLVLLKQNHEILLDIREQAVLQTELLKDLITKN